MDIFEFQTEYLNSVQKYRESDEVINVKIITEIFY